VHFQGTVYDETNGVIKGASVEVKQNAAVFNILRADEHGNYNVYLPLDGDYDITIMKSGYVQKKYFVSTKNIPVEKSQVQFATNVADVVLLNRYEGIDYGLFDKPMNKYFYQADKDNVHFDEEYLKEMKEAMKEFKNRNEAVLAKENVKAKQAKLQEEKLAVEKAKAEKIMKENAKAEEKLALEKSLQEKLVYEKDKQKIKVAEKKNQLTATYSIEHKTDKTIVTSGLSLNKNAKSPAIIALLAKYKPGITEEIFEGNGVYVIQRVLVRDDMVWIYQKKIFSWGGVACFRDKEAITESAFESETKKS